MEPKQDCLPVTIAVPNLLLRLLCKGHNLLPSSHRRHRLKTFSDWWSAGKIRGAKVFNSCWRSMSPNSPRFIFVREAKLLENNVFGAVLLRCRRIFSRGSNGALRGTAGWRHFFPFWLSARDAYDDLPGPGAIHVGKLCCAVRNDSNSREVCRGSADVFL